MNVNEFHYNSYKKKWFDSGYVHTYEKRPDLIGDICLNDAVYECLIWFNISKAGLEYMKITAIYKKVINTNNQIQMEQKNNTGAIFKNDKKTAENQPDYRGKMMVDGKEYEISLWVREAQTSGIKYFSAAIKEPYVKPTEQQAPVSTSKKIQDATEDDGLPF